MKILSIEDDAVDLMSIKRVLGDDFEVDVSLDGEEAMQKVQENQYDCILLDYLLPDTTGVDLLSQIKRITNTPVVVLTGKGDEKIAVELMKAGVEDYLIKNETEDKLKSTVEKAVEKSQKQKQANEQIASKLDKLKNIPLTDI